MTIKLSNVPATLLDITGLFGFIGSFWEYWSNGMVGRVAEMVTAQHYNVLIRRNEVMRITNDVLFRFYAPGKEGLVVVFEPRGSGSWQ